MSDRSTHQGTFKDGNGGSIVGATVSVFLTGTNTPANIYENSTGGSIVNSVTTDSSGGFKFWITLGNSDGYTADQNFRISMSKTGFTTKTYDDIEIFHHPHVAFHTFVNGDTTPSISEGDNYKTGNTSATTISDLDDGYDGQRVLVVFGDSDTTVDFTGTNLKGNGGVDWGPNTDDAMLCTYDGTTWFCMAIDV